MAAATDELKVNRDLLNPGFDGYKLSLQQVSHYELQLDNCPVLVASLSDRQYSAEHLRAFAANNHLIIDPWQPEDAAYFIDADWRVMRVRLPSDCRQLETPQPVARLIDDAAGVAKRQASCSPTLVFASRALACAADGLGRVVVMETGERSGLSTGQWETLGRVSLNAEEKNGGEGEGEKDADSDAFVIVDARAKGGENTGEIGEVDCLLLRVRQAEEATAPFQCVLHWLTIRLADSGPRVARHRRLTTAQAPDYAAVSPDCHQLLLGCHGDYSVDLDDEGASSSSTKTGASSALTYSWTQTEASATARVPLPAGVDKANLRVEIGQTDIAVAASGRVLLSGRLYEPIDAEASGWTLEGGEGEGDSEAAGQCCVLRLEGKRSPNWPRLLAEHDRPPADGLDEAKKAEAEGKEEEKKEGKEEDEEEDEGAPYNSQELEECDLEEAGTSLKLIRLVEVDEKAEEKGTQSGRLKAIGECKLDASQWLFQRRLAADEAPSVCLRRDVDGLIWRPSISSSSSPTDDVWRHVATFDAFGFVRASKREAKFVSCPTNFAYCAVCDCYRHVYIYHSPRTPPTQLRNRRSGEQVSQLASQQVASVGDQEPLIGFACLNDKILVLTERCLHLLRVQLSP